ncbi:MAG: flagellar hook-associated protein FlgK [Betaproteobacteria bacterium]|nr:flagellar hook-associated protein FlgK [Betaproteobacteria bacterium]
MSSGVVGIAVSGLNAAQAGIRTTQQNIANINTAGYRRQEVVFTAEQPQGAGHGYLGSGVSVTEVRHQYSQFLDTEVMLNQSQLARHDEASNRAAIIDKLLGNKASSLTPAMDQFFAAMQEVANDPTSSVPRQNLLAAGNNLSQRLNMLGNKLEDYRTGSNNDLADLSRQVNVLTSQIAQANINVQRSITGNGRPANDVVDARDHLVEELNKLVNVTRIDQSDGTTSIYLGSGQSLVAGQTVFALGTSASSTDSLTHDLVIDLQPRMYSSLMADSSPVLGNNIQALGASAITGGKIAGVLDYRENVLVPAIRDLNRVALSVAAEVNEQHRSGVDYNLAAGGDFFANPVQPLSGSTGRLQMNLSNDLLVDPVGYELSYNGANYTITALSTSVSVTGNLAAVTAGKGFTLSASTAPVAGDTWIIGDQARQMGMSVTTTAAIAAAAAGATGPGDNTNALALAGLQSGRILNNGTSTYSMAYNQTVGRTASQSAQSDLNRDAFQSLADAAVATRQSLVGVNLDEEASNLIRFQQAYQASARAIQVANQIFDELLAAVR